MGRMVAPVLPEAPRKMLAMRGESLRKPLADDEMRRFLGRVLERSLEITGWTKQQASSAMGYTDQSALSRWISGTENPVLSRYFAVEDLRRGFLIALAEATGVPVHLAIAVPYGKAVGQ